MTAAAELAATSNEAALRFRLRAEGVAELADHAALRRFAADEPAAFNAALAEFADPRRAATGCLVVRRRDGGRLRVDDATAAEGLPGGLATALARLGQPDALLTALAAVLLDADLRPDDRLLVAGAAPWPWLAAITQGIPLVLADDATPATLRAIAAAEAATAIVAPAAWLDDAPQGGPRGVRLIAVPPA